MRNVGLTVSYHRNSWHNQQFVWNRALTLADYAKGSVTVPNDPRLEERAGATIDGIWDLARESRGKADTVLTRWQNIPGSGEGPKQFYNGVDIGVSSRFSNGALVNGGVTLGRRVNDSCWQNDLPFVAASSTGNSITGTTIRNDDYCDERLPLWHSDGSTIKVSAIYPLPYKFSASAVYRSLPGLDVSANQVFSNAAIEPSLGRPIGACTSTPCTNQFSLNVWPDGTLIEDYSRENVLDIKVTRDFPIGRWVFNLSGEVYNALNRRNISGVTQTVGGTFRQVTGLLAGRLFKVVVGADF
jgi:hypothetical protein